MNEDIKEALGRLDFNEWEVDLYKVPITWCEMYDIRDYITNLQEENKKLVKVIEDIDKYIHIFKIEDIGEKTMLILNDILLIKNGLGKDVVRLNKLTELKGGSDDVEN